MRRFRNKGNILIDLTSLLDVIFIVLLVVISKLQLEEVEVQKDKIDIIAQETQLAVTKEQYDDQLESLANIEEYVAVISVNARFDPDLVTRHIEVMNSDKKSSIPVIPELIRLNTSDGFEALKGYLESFIQEDPQRMVVLSLNEGDEDILYRDEKEITTMFRELQNEYGDNVRIKN